MADTPEAAPAAPVTGTEETPTTTTQTTETATAPAAPQGEASQDNYGFTSDQLKELSSFIKGQGGYDKAFPAWKDSISKPQPKIEDKQPEVKAEAPAQPTESVQPQPNRPAEGYLSPNDIVALQYQNMLASDPKYEKIADYIKSDGWLKEMKAMGMTPIDGQGNLNNRVIRQFLDLKASTVAATQPATPVTSTPTVDYVEVGDTITDINKAYAVIQQNMQLSAAGKAQHPKTEEAKKFIADHFAARKTGGRK